MGEYAEEDVMAAMDDAIYSGRDVAPLFPKRAEPAPPALEMDEEKVRRLCEMVWYHLSDGAANCSENGAEALVALAEEIHPMMPHREIMLRERGL